MRLKIFFLTVLAVHVIVIGGAAIAWCTWAQGSWILHNLISGDHKCPKEDGPSTVIVIWSEFMILIFGLLFSRFVVWPCLKHLYRSIDALFPERKPHA